MSFATVRPYLPTSVGALYDVYARDPNRHYLM